MSLNEKQLKRFAKFEAPMLIGAHLRGEKRSIYADADAFLTMEALIGETVPETWVFAKAFEDALRDAVDASEV